MQLDDLFIKYGTDKGGPGGWGYSPAYEKYLLHRRREVTSVLEIGICGYRDIPNNVVGASLYAWREYFPKADVYGIDNDSRFIFQDDRIHTACANAYSPDDLPKALIDLRAIFGFDFIVDDAVHDPLPQIDLFRMLWPLLHPGGIYAIEDVCPYKCHDNDLRAMASVLMQMFSDAHVSEYRTHKEERLLIITKD